MECIAQSNPCEDCEIIEVEDETYKHVSEQHEFHHVWYKIINPDGCKFLITESYTALVGKNDPWYDERNPPESFWLDEDTADYEEEPEIIDYTWIMESPDGCYHSIYGKDRYIQGLSFTFHAECGDPLEWTLIDSLDFGGFASDIVNCDFEHGPFVMTGPDAAAWLVGQRADYTDDPDYGVHISNEDMWDIYIDDLNAHPCSYYAVTSTKDNHVNHWGCVGRAYDVDVLDGYGNFTPPTLSMTFGYLMLVDESPFCWEEVEPVGLGCDPPREVHFDGFWADEIAFGCTLLDYFLCIQPPAQAIRLRASDDIGNWKRSNDLIPELSEYDPDVIYLHPSEGEYSIFEWSEYGIQGNWNVKDQYQQYVNYPNDFEHPGNHEGYIIPILYDVLPKIPGDVIVIHGLLDPPMDDSLDDPPTNPGTTYDFDINENTGGDYPVLLEVNDDGGSFFGNDPYITPSIWPEPYEYTIIDPEAPLPELNIHTSAYGGDNYQVLIEIVPCLPNYSSTYFEESPVVNVWRKGFVDVYEMENEDPDFEESLIPNFSKVKGTFDDGFFKLVIEEDDETTYWQSMVSWNSDAIYRYCDIVEPDWLDYVPFHNFEAPDWEYTKHYHIHLQGIYKFIPLSGYGRTWGPGEGDWRCKHKHSLVSIHNIYTLTSNYPHITFVHTLRFVTNHEVGRSLGLTMDEDDCPENKCVMGAFEKEPDPEIGEEDVNVLWLGINCIDRIRAGWNNGLDETCYD